MTVPLVSFSKSKSSVLWAYDETANKPAAKAKNNFSIYVWVDFRIVDLHRRTKDCVDPGFRHWNRCPSGATPELQVLSGTEDNRPTYSGWTESQNQARTRSRCEVRTLQDLARASLLAVARDVFCPTRDAFALWVECTLQTK